MYEIDRTNRFTKEFRQMIKRGKDGLTLEKMLNLLVDNLNKGVEVHLSLPQKYRLHKLTNATGLCECHIEPDWLLIFSLKNEAVILERTGTHSDVFNKIRR